MNECMYVRGVLEKDCNIACISLTIGFSPKNETPSERLNLQLEYSSSYINEILNLYELLSG